MCGITLALTPQQAYTVCMDFFLYLIAMACGVGFYSWLLSYDPRKGKTDSTASPSENLGDQGPLGRR